MIVLDLISHFVASIVSIVLPLLAIVDAIRPIVGNGALADSGTVRYRSFSDTRTIGYRSITNARSITDARTGAANVPRKRRWTFR